ncbi:MAG: hypothetical protein QE271_10775 [Bacteriovoracaceae bacterium]|nr:hypothetical protein [Bacteriovoracaceae bacterium]
MSNLTAICKNCQNSQAKAVYQCGVCGDPVCKKCSLFPSETFSYLRTIPPILTHDCYCGSCYEQNVAGPTATYNEMMEKAKEITIYTTKETKLTRLFVRKHLPYEVENCADEREAIMRMSFFAVQDNFNCLIDVEITKKKVANGSHKKFIFAGKSVPHLLDLKRSRW